MVRKSWFWLIAFAVIIGDQLTKWVIVASIPLGQSIDVIPKVFSLTYIQNTGAGFGILQGQNTIFILVALIAIAVIVFSMKKILEEHHTTWLAALILGGAVGNLIDRIWHGFVVDFINFHVWPAFNIADSALVIGVIGLLWMSFTEKK
jgi:signal peptidase II